MKISVFSKVALCASVAVAAISMAALIPSAALASSLVYDRGLPTDNLNNAAGADRSNVAWAWTADSASGPYYWVGDTFSLATSASIDTLRVWVTTNPLGGNFGDYYNDMSLYIGSASGTTVNKVATSTFTGGSNASSNANVTVTAVTYSGGANYQASSGTFRQIWEIDFSNLGLYAAGNYVFALTGPTNPNATDPLTFVHASNAAKGGVTADGADGLISIFNGADGAPILTLDTVDSPWNSAGNGWDKSSDLNVQVFASPTPVPAALPLFASGAGVLGYFGWRRKKKAAVA